MMYENEMEKQQVQRGPVLGTMQAGRIAGHTVGAEAVREPQVSSALARQAGEIQRLREITSDVIRRLESVLRDEPGRNQAKETATAQQVQLANIIRGHNEAISNVCDALSYAMDRLEL